MKQRRTLIAGTIAQHALKQGVSADYAQDIAAYLLAERRSGELDSILRDIQADWQRSGYVEVLARSAHDLSKDVTEQIKTQIQLLFPEAKTVVVTPVYDPDIIGGVKLSLADQQLDMSVEAKLNKFKQLTVTGKDV